MLQKALPYAEVVTANNHDDIQAAVAPQFRPLHSNEDPSSFKPYLVEVDLGDVMSTFVKSLIPLFTNKELPAPFAAKPVAPVHSLQSKGIFARIYVHTTDPIIVLAFRGTEPSPTDRPDRFLLNWKTNIEQGLGKDDSAYRFASTLAKLAKQAYPGKEIICTGISLGGGLSQYAAITNGLTAYAFNSPKLGESFLNQIESKLATYPALAKSLEKIHHLHVEGDILQATMFLAPGKKVGDECSISVSDDKLDELHRHYTDNLVPSIERTLANYQNTDESEA